MPGRLFLETPLEDLAQIAGVEAGIAGDPPRRNIAPGQEVLVLTSGGWRKMRWGIVPVGRVNARGRPVMETIVNARSETLFDKSAFAGTGRGVVPADGWYEWTGTARRKQPWRLARRDGAPLWFAAITDRWEAPGGQVLDQVATVTCAPSAEVAEIHHRMGVLLAPEDLALWLTGTEDAVRQLMVPTAEGALAIEMADGVDWSGA
ncbi:SOS response-associated peptidase [Mesobacterium pallidum]|uniref:SOS response-associated peptidase n=1 Tax=Mesobacterium pallidum TaxID=2872037 RepID=UPI001EE1C670|nr:SOS response-associated peptidase [Mesobacterium pallidum]